MSARVAGDRGMATAELAACLPVLVLVLAVALTAVSAVSTRARLQDAARELARATARGDPATGRRLASQDAPGSTMSVSTGGGPDGWARATVSARIRPFGGVLPALTVTEHATSALEPDEEGATR